MATFYFEAQATSCESSVISPNRGRSSAAPQLSPGRADGRTDGTPPPLLILPLSSTSSSGPYLQSNVRSGEAPERRPNGCARRDDITDGGDRDVAGCAGPPGARARVRIPSGSIVELFSLRDGGCGFESPLGPLLIFWSRLGVLPQVRSDRTHFGSPWN